MSSTSLHDPLKSIEDIHKPDERQQFFVVTLAETHAELNGMILSESVPIDVRQLFETAKNVSLYSWFVYPFHQVAEMVAFSAFEMALRIRAEHSGSTAIQSKRQLKLYELLQLAQKENWLRTDDFPSLKLIGTERAIHKKSIEAFTQQLAAIQLESPPKSAEDVEALQLALLQISDQDILDAMGEIDIVENLVNTVPKLRNRLAHGSTVLHPNSRKTLRIICEAIDQLFVIKDPV